MNKKEMNSKQGRTNSKAKKLKELNALFKLYAKANKKIGEALETTNERAVSRIQNEIDELDARFNELKSSMDKVKFDWVNGEYFYAAGEEPSTEKYRVRVREIYEKVVEVSATDKGDALKKARALSDASDYTISDFPICNFEIVCD